MSNVGYEKDILDGYFIRHHRTHQYCHLDLKTEWHNACA